MVTPYYNKPTQAGLVAQLHRAARLLCAAHHHLQHPRPVGGGHDARDDGELARLPRIVGVKDADGKIERVSQQRPAAGPIFVQLSGEDATRWAQRARRGGVHFRHRQRGAAPVRAVPGGDLGGGLQGCPGIPGPPDAAA